jgi:hypothetical protein
LVNLKQNLSKLISLIGLLLVSSFGVTAQSTVFNIPSTDVQAERRVYVEADFTAHLSSFETGGYQSYGPRIIYGLSKRTEIGINAFYTNTSPAEPAEIQPNFKLKFYENEEKGFAASAGTIVFVPLTQRSSNSTRAMVYAVASKNVGGSYGPRITAGSYALIGSFEAGASKRGVLLGYEQPITKKLSFIADWSSGNNDFGYVVAGVGITLSRRSALYLGYNVGNQGRGNNSLGVYYGFNF